MAFSAEYSNFPESKTVGPSATLTTFETPTEIIISLLDEEEVSEIELRIDFIVQEYCQRYLGELPDLSLIYIPDRGIMPLLDKDHQPVKPETKADFLQKLQYIRSRIRTFLEKNGAQVIELEQTLRASIDTNLLSTGWVPALNEEFKGVGFKVYFGPLHPFSPFKYKDFPTTGFMPNEKSFEQVFPLQNATLSITHYYPEHLTLHHLNCDFQKNPSILDVEMYLLMSGIQICHALHTAGFIHGDIKPGNLLVAIEVLEKTDNVFSFRTVREFLIDFEGMRKIGEDNIGTRSTRLFSENYYYFRKFSSKEPLKPLCFPQDEKMDIFSWGITILEVALRKYIGNDLEDILYACRLYESDEKEQEKVLFSYIDFTNLAPALKEMIKSMVQCDRVKRPSLDKVIAFFQNFRSEFVKAA